MVNWQQVYLLNDFRYKKIRARCLLFIHWKWIKVRVVTLHIYDRQERKFSRWVALKFLSKLLRFYKSWRFHALTRRFEFAMQWKKTLPSRVTTRSYLAKVSGYTKFDIIIRASFMYTVYFTTLSYALGNFCSLN